MPTRGVPVEEKVEKSVLKLLTLRDLITIVSVAVSIALAWGVFGTRIALLEREVVERKEQIEEIRKETLELQVTIRNVDIQNQKNGLYIDQILQQGNHPTRNMSKK